MNKIKILLIVGFSDSEIREHLSFRKESKLFHNLIKLFRLPARVGHIKDHALWVRNIILDFEKRDDIELHVAGPHIRLKNSIEEFESRGVRYHFFRSEFSAFARLIKNYHLWKFLQRSGYYTQKILKRVNPDLVILSGAENPVTSVSILYANQYPRLCLCQTVYNDPEMHRFSAGDSLKIAVEQAILSEVRYIGVYCKKHYDLVKQQITEDQYVFKYNYPPRGKLLEPTETAKKYDFVNFAATHGKGKGSHDSIRALAIVKKNYPEVTLNIVGGCSEKVKKELLELIKELGLESNVIFTPFFEDRNDVLLHIQQSRFAVLPSKVDNTSGTMSQAMSLGIPIVVYKTSGTPAFNKEKECALIAEMDDVEGLANHMLTLMENPEKAEMLKKNGRWYIENRMHLHSNNWERLVNCFLPIIDNYKNGSPIPTEGLFNPETDE